MNVIIEKSRLSGALTAPPSKSMAHRLLICAGLSEGVSTVNNISFSEDILATLDCLGKMGAEIEKGDSSVKIKGASPAELSVTEDFPARESGSTLRFFIPLLWLGKAEQRISGYGRLMERPLTVYEKIAKEKKLTLVKNEKELLLKGSLSSGDYTLRGDVSSQFISGLLFALPLCDGDSRIILTGKIESRSYIDMTVEALALFGVTAKWENENTLFIKGSQRYQSIEATAEGDYSNAAFSDAFNFIGGSVKISGLNENSVQGDRIYKKYFNELMSEGAVLDVGDCPDLAPVLMTLAVIHKGAVLTNTARLKIKESDRGEAMKTELSKFGADITVNENEIIINKTALHKSEALLSGHNDHRIVMSLTVMCALFGGEIEGAQAVKKSYPDFFDRMEELGLKYSVRGE